MDTESYTVLFIVNCSEVVRVDVSSTYPVNFDRSALMLPYRICWIQSVPGLCGDILLLKFPFLYNPVFIELETYLILGTPGLGVEGIAAAIIITSVLVLLSPLTLGASWEVTLVAVPSTIPHPSQ